MALFFQHAGFVALAEPENTLLSYGPISRMSEALLTLTSKNDPHGTANLAHGFAKAEH
jgi:hypothetical protein